MVLVLSAITIIAALSLGSVYNATKEPIELAKKKKQEQAIKMVVPEFDNAPGKEMVAVQTAEGLELKVFPAKKGGNLVGAAVEAITSKGFGGEVKIMVGFDAEGNIVDYMVLEHKETPGLGTKMEPWFRVGSGDVRGKNPGSNNLTVSKDGGEIDAITAATISSRAFLDAVAIGYEGYQKALEQIK